MMKRFFKNGKWVGLLAVGLLFAGCMSGSGGDDSSSEAALAANQQTTPTGVQMTFDPVEGSLNIGDGAEASLVYADSVGHRVVIRNDANAANCVDLGGGTHRCAVRVVNESLTKYAANAFFVGTACSDCVANSLVIDNADFLDAAATVPNGILNGTVGDDGGPGGTASADGFAVCIVEDGDYTVLAPYNVKGCTTHPIGPTFKPRQVLHPQCGSFPILLDFSATAPTTFWATVTADWFDWNPIGNNGSGRYDFTNRSTFFVMATALDDDLTGDGSDKVRYGGTMWGDDWLRIGSYRRSTILSGWGATGSNVLNPGDYFAISTALEYSDRLEGQTNIASKALQALNGGYEYAYNFGYQLRYDTETVARVQTLQDVNGGLDSINGDVDHMECIKEVAGKKNYDTCTIAFPTWSGYGATPQLAWEGVGWIAANYALIADFQFFAYTQAQNTFVGGKIVNGDPRAFATDDYPMPLHNAHFGLANLLLNPYNTPYDPTWRVIWPADNPVILQGVDAAPDLPLSIYYFYVKPNTDGKGMGSEFWVDQFASNTFFFFANTDETLEGSGAGITLTDDQTAMCISSGSGYEEGPPDSGASCTGSGDVWIRSGQETPQTNIDHAGPGLATGGYQQWPAHICVAGG